MRFTLKLSGWDKVEDFVDALPLELKKLANKGLKRSAAEASREMTHNAPKATSQLARGIHFKEVDQLTYEVGSDDNYAVFAEEGTQAGRFPNVDGLKDWVKVKIRPETKELDKVTFLMGRKIEQEGAKAHPFIKPVAESQKFLNRMKTLVEGEIRGAMV